MGRMMPRRHYHHDQDIRQLRRRSVRFHPVSGGEFPDPGLWGSLLLGEGAAMKRIIIMSGVSGSGKSTQARAAAGETGWVLSTDNVFTDSFGIYKFDPSKLSEAHGVCFRSFIDKCQNQAELILVDNCNTTTWELSPYVLGGQAYGYRVCIRTLMCAGEAEAAACAARNSHQVPVHAVIEQHRRLKKRVLPSHWQNIFSPIQGI